MIDIISARSFVMLALAGYFVAIIYRASNKLKDGNIGTIFRIVNSKTVKEIYLH